MSLSLYAYISKAEGTHEHPEVDGDVGESKEEGVLAEEAEGDDDAAAPEVPGQGTFVQPGGGGDGGGGGIRIRIGFTCFFVLFF